MADTTKYPLISVPFLPGNGNTVIVDVIYIAGFPRGVDGTCAFCHGDPCAESSAPESNIALYFEENKAWTETCPMCDGSAS